MSGFRLCNVRHDRLRSRAVVRLTAIPAVFGVAALLVVLINRRRVAAVVATLAAVTAVVLIGVDLTAVVAGAHPEASFPNFVNDVGIHLRATGLGYAVILGACVALAVVSWAQNLTVRESACMLLGLLGLALAALGATLFVVAVGLYLVVVSYVANTVRDRRVRLDELVAIVLLTFAAVGLLAASLWLQTQTGSDDFYVVSSSSASTVGVMWALAGLAMMLSIPLGSPNDRRPALWAAVITVPALVLVLFRLDQSVSPSGLSDTWRWVTPLVVAIACLATIMAARQPHPVAGQRWLLLAPAAVLLVLMSVTSSSQPTAIAAMAAALELAALLAATLDAHQPSILRRIGVISIAGGPVGFGLVATVLSLTSVSEIGRAGAPTFIALAVVLVVTVVVGVQLALRQPSLGVTAASRWPVAAGVIAISVAAATLPGVVGSVILPALGGDSGTAIDAATLRVGGGTWAGGYIAVAVVVLVTAAVAINVLLGGARRPRVAVQQSPTRSLRLRGWRFQFRRRRQLSKLMITVDDWLVTQPKLATVVLACFAGLILVR